jgi:hypothetical protein
MALDILVKNVALPGNEGPCDVGIAGGELIAEPTLKMHRYFDIPAMPAT